jgi:hypothetical protein
MITLNRPMTRAYPVDSVQPAERLKDTRKPDRRFPWAAVAAVLAFACLAYENVAHRDSVVALKEQHAKELRAKDKELAPRKGEPTAQRCNEYVVHMEGMAVTFCRKPGIWM